MQLSAYTVSLNILTHHRTQSNQGMKKHDTASNSKCQGPDSKRWKWQRLRTEREQSQVTKSLTCPSEEFRAKVKGKHLKGFSKRSRMCCISER